MDAEKLKRMANAVRTGGKGTMRRKKKAVHKTATTDDKRLQNTLKRLNVNTIPGIEEVNIYKDDSVICFTNPKVQASIAANTYVISGVAQQKKMADMIPPHLLEQLGQGDFQKRIQRMANGQGQEEEEEEEEDVPELVENFEDAAQA